MIDRRFLQLCVLLIAMFVNSSAGADDATDQWVVDFDIFAAAADKEGKYLLAFGKPVGTDDETPQKMLLFDLDRRKLLRVAKAERPKHFGIDSERIFLVPKDGKSLKVLSRRSFAELESVELKEEVLGMTLISQRKVGLLLDKGMVTAVTYFDRETLKRDESLEAHEGFAGILHDYPQNKSLYRTRTELKNRDTDEHFCIVEAPFLPRFATRKNPTPILYPQGDTGGRRILLESYPLRGAVGSQADGLSWGKAKETADSVCSWNWRWNRNGDGSFLLLRSRSRASEPEEAWVISRDAENNLNSRFQFLVFRKKEVVFISNQVLTYIPKKTMSSDRLRFERQSVPVFDTTSSAKIQLATTGGIGKKVWSSLSQSPHIWIDETTGMLTVDTPELWAEHLAVASDRKSGFRAASREQSATEFKRILGKPVPDDKSPFCVPVKLRVEDSKLQRAETSLFLIVLAPKSDYAMAKRVAPVIEGITNIVGSTLNTPTKPDPGKTIVETTLDGRIAETQRKAEEIKSQLSRIESLVREIRKLERADK